MRCFRNAGLQASLHISPEASVDLRLVHAQAFQSFDRKLLLRVSLLLFFGAKGNCSEMTGKMSAWSSGCPGDRSIGRCTGILVLRIGYACRTLRASLPGTMLAIPKSQHKQLGNDLQASLIDQNWSWGRS